MPGPCCPRLAHGSQSRPRHEVIDAPTGSAWELRVYLGADPVSGEERYATKTVRAGKRGAQRMLNEMKAESDRGLAARTTAKVEELLDRWLELARADFSPKTTREVTGYIERNLRPALGDVRLSKLTDITPPTPDELGRGRTARTSPCRPTLNVYSHFVPEADREAAEILGGLGAVDGRWWIARMSPHGCPIFRVCAEERGAW